MTPSGGAAAVDALRSLRGELTVLGSSVAAPNRLRTFFGPPHLASAGQDEVSCAFAPQGSVSSAGIQTGPNVSISAAISGRAQPQATLVLVFAAAAQPSPFAQQTSFSVAALEQPVQLVARLSHESESSFYEYSYSADSSALPARSSSCSVQVTEFSERHIVGQAACKDLFATTPSLDSAGAPRATASVTVAFDCPVQVVDKLGQHVHEGSGGASGAGGASGTSSVGGGSTGGTGGTGGSGGTGVVAAGSGGSAGMSSPPPSMGLGVACSQSSDCAAPLSCHYDTQDYIADMQCSVACSDESTCTTLFGPSSMCIGANVCVRKCSTDLDCAAKTHCNASGWCERGGPGSGVPYCAGSPTPCGLLTSLQCIGAEGCKDNSMCAGIATDCYDLFDSYSCSSQQGCFWSSSTNSCSGSALYCSLNHSSLSCNLQEGCSWRGGCTGTPKACEAQFVSLCSSQPGCSQQTD